VTCGTSDNLIQEKFANAFASAFLLPKDSLFKDIKRRKGKGQITLNDLMILACEYEVSLAALLWRLVNLGKLDRKNADKVLSSSVVREYDKQIRKSKSWKTPHISQKYLCMVFEGVSLGLLSKMRAAEYLEVGVIELEDVFLKAGLKMQEKSNFEIPIT
jgi:Zn-dependent peptidase ImmA (M78 family)